jgi:hypothetical protein
MRQGQVDEEAEEGLQACGGGRGQLVGLQQPVGRVSQQLMQRGGTLGIQKIGLDDQLLPARSQDCGGSDPRGRLAHACALDSRRSRGLPRLRSRAKASSLIRGETSTLKGSLPATKRMMSSTILSGYRARRHRLT